VNFTGTTALRAKHFKRVEGKEEGQMARLLNFATGRTPGN